MSSAQDIALEATLNTYLILTAVALAVIFSIKELLQRVQRPKINQILVDPQRFFDLEIRPIE